MVTAPMDAAERLARAWVEAGLCACVNVLPARSVYRWKGDVVAEAEATLVIKVAEQRVEALRERVLRDHPYELPEFVVLDVDEERSHGPYLEWVRGT
jgi:periplasmic divalent cation tolerance protein